MPFGYHKQPVYVQVDAPFGGTVVLKTAAPTPVAKVYDINGDVVSSYNNITVTTESGAGVSKKAYAIIDADTPGLSKGYYNVSILLGYTGDDTVDRVVEPYRSLMLYWTDAPTLVRQLLGKSSTELPDNVLDNMFGLVLSNMLCSYNSLPAYSLLVHGDRKPFDNALAYMVAVMYNMAPSMPGPAGPMTMYQSGTDKAQWAQPANFEAPLSDTDNWLGLATSNLMCVSSISDEFNDTYNAPIVQLAGARRTAREALGFSELATPLYDMILDDRLRYEFKRLAL